MTHEGWSNYPTWCVNLYFQNDERMSRWALELIAQATDDYVPDGDEYEYESVDPVTWLADAIQDLTRKEMPGCIEQATGLWGDLITHALEQVDYREIATEWLAEHALNQEGGQ
ncbi:MAG: hypothetical protein U5L04_04090 [Trueperaceae bacterium]|nr:hypothetical protein [Trueperaceae bacterium]